MESSELVRLRHIESRLNDLSVKFREVSMKAEMAKRELKEVDIELKAAIQEKDLLSQGQLVFTEDFY